MDEELTVAITQAIADFHNKAALEGNEREIRKAYNKFINDRVKLHGPCPVALRHVIFESAWAQLGVALRHSGLSPRLWIYVKIAPPPKGTKMRKVYDNWMRQKV